MGRSVRYRVFVTVVLSITATGCAEPASRPMPAAPIPTAAGTPASTSAPLPEPTAPAPPPPFASEVTAVTAADLPHSWRPGCPVGPDELRLLRLRAWGFDGRPHIGTLVVNKAVAADVVKIFAILYGDRFPIRLMQPVDAYGGSDDASMAADNTSGFNCRNAVANGPPRWSTHAYGRAIDVNPVENPYILNGKVLPPAGAAFVDRSTYRAGMAVPGGTVVRAFASAGWRWGGEWRSTPDYQHFSR